MSIAKTVSEVVVDGYGTGETDFATQLAQSDPQVQSDFWNLVIQPILDAEANDGGSLVLKVEGHSDRVDDPNLSHEEKRQLEFAASVNRTNNAVDTILATVQAQSGGTFPADFAFSSHNAVTPVACGGAALVETNPTSEAQRKRNRRVVLVVIHFEVFL